MSSQSLPAFKTGSRWIAAASAIALLGTGSVLAYLFWQQQPPKAVSARVLTVERNTVEETINASGAVELGDQQTLTSPTEGAVEQVFVNSGDRVTAGQTLITLRNAERETATTNQQLLIAQQEETLQRSRQRIAEAEVQLAAYRADLERLNQLVSEGAIAETGTEILNKQEQIRNTEAQLRDAQSGADTALLELERLRVEDQKVQQQLRETVVTAPIDGMILNIGVLDGDGVEVRTELLTLGDPAEEVVRLKLSTLDAARVRVGQTARVSVIGPNPEVYMGRVVYLSPLAVTDSSSNGEQSAQSVVTTLVQLDQPTRTLIPGSQVNVEIILEARPNVVALGTETIQRNGEDPFVWVIDDQGQAQQQPVELGLEGLVTIEVTDGLESGDQVIVPSPDQPLTAGTPIEAESSSPSASPEANESFIN